MDKLIYLFIPMLSVYIVSYYYPVTKQAGKDIWFRPPPYVFGIVWPILLLLIGFSWYLRPNLSFYYTILTILLSTWSIFWSYSKIYSLINIIITAFFTLYLILKKYSKKSSVLLIPLFLWLSFASLLNFYSI
jgi:tryptophan-rich sensory protein|tara:strand:- start:115 stop:510 length:396 start_codon:yes stop_codon:yes gene_type:complete